MGIDPSVGALKHYFETVKKEQHTHQTFSNLLILSIQDPLMGIIMQIAATFEPNKRKYKVLELFI